MNQEMFHDVNQPENFQTFLFETISDKSFTLKYMNEMGYYSKTFAVNDDFWKENSKYFLNQFDAFKDILQECLTKTNDFLNYEIFNESNKVLSLNINHNSPINLDWSIPINLDNDQYKIKLLEKKIKSLEEEIENVKTENKSLRLRNIRDEKWIIIINPPEKDRSYSSIWNEGGAKANSCLDSNSCWSASVNNNRQWMVMDLKETKEIRGFIIQGRYNYHLSQQVTKLIFLISDDQVIWTNCGEFECSAVNKDNIHEKRYINPKLKVSLGIPLNARYVKIIPSEWQNHISMRIGLLLKEYPDEKTKGWTVFKTPVELASKNSLGGAGRNSVEEARKYGYLNISLTKIGSDLKSSKEQSMESNDSGFIWFPKNNFAGIRQSVTLTPDEFINNSIYKIKNKSDLKGHWIGEVYVKPGASMKLLKQKEKEGFEILYDQ
jgi:hypothetical protein